MKPIVLRHLVVCEVHVGHLEISLPDKFYENCFDQGDTEDIDIIGKDLMVHIIPEDLFVQVHVELLVEAAGILEKFLKCLDEFLVIEGAEAVEPDSE